jgi:exonuclease III
MRICCWNVRRATSRSAVWELFTDIAPDLALLQEVGGLPKSVADQYQVVMKIAAGKRSPQRFRTAILVRGAVGTVGTRIRLSSCWDWVNQELQRFEGNLLAYWVSIGDREYRVLSAYSPAWPLEAERLREVDVEPVRLRLNSQVWLTELLWAALLDSCDPTNPAPWVIGGDLNSSETFDYSGQSGNLEILQRMRDLGLVECLRHFNGALVPTFRNPRGGKIIHQLDHLFVSASLGSRLVMCTTADHARVFDSSLSDHLPIIADFAILDGRAV